jgi:dTDP-4-dehydrorhamnose reductase
VHFVLLGAGGQLGRALLGRLPGKVTALLRSQADLSRPEDLTRLLDDLSPDAVVNCAAYNFVDRAESEPAAAFAVNALGPRALAAWCGQRDRLLVHFSSDHVFGLEDDRQRPYAEADAPGPLSVYGASKLAGEYLVRSGCRRHLVIRTCGLYGQHGQGGKGGNFVETMLALARTGRPIRVVNDQVCTPTPAADLADATVDLIERACVGLFHRTSAGACSWFRFAGAIFHLTGRRVELVPISTRDYGAAARRPAYSVLESRLPPMRSWEAALASYLAEKEKFQ